MKIYTFLLLIIILYSITGCGASAANPENGKSDTTTTEEFSTEKVLETTEVPSVVISSEPSGDVKPTTPIAKTTQPINTEVPTITPTPEIPTETPTLDITEVSAPTLSLVFSEDFSKPNEAFGRFNYTCTYFLVQHSGFYTLFINNKVGYQNCLMHAIKDDPKTSEIEKFSNIKKYEVSYKYSSGGNDSFFGIESDCDNLPIGLWSSNSKIIFTNNGKVYPLKNIPENSDTHELGISFGNNLTVFYDGEILSYPTNPSIFKCSTYPNPDLLGSGLWVKKGQSINTEIYEIQVYQ